MKRTEGTERKEALPGKRPRQDAGMRVLNPRMRVPVSLIIDDSTCLVNLSHFGIPAFAEAFPDRYPQDWRRLPREIPDAFVREFGEWCHENGVKGKYSIVPYHCAAPPPKRRPALRRYHDARRGWQYWPAVMREIRAMGYDYVITEVCGDRAVYEETCRVMDTILALPS